MALSLIMLGFLAFFIVSLTVGIRLIRLWTRTHALPELLIGVGVLGIGPIGFGGTMIATQIQPVQPALAQIGYAVGTLAMVGGAISKCLFNWLVYRPESRTAMAVTLTATACLVALFGFRALTVGFVPETTPRIVTHLQSGLLIFALLWGATESFRYYGLMRRRRALGLADPVICNRFLMWGVGAFMAGLGSAINTIASVVLGVSSGEDLTLVASSSAHGFVAAVAISLAFLPPARYAAWLRRRHAATQPTVPAH